MHASPHTSQFPHHVSASTVEFNRRAWLLGGGLAAAGLIGAPLVHDLLKQRADVFIARHQKYDGDLAATMRAGLRASGLETHQLKGKRVLLKPNLVEPNRDCPQMTTHPAVIVAAAEVFRGYGATVSIGEGPGHVRDTEMALLESGVQEALDDAELAFADLNYQRAKWVANQGRASRLEGFYFPQSVVEADLIVSLPKMKTHHWMGVTCALKNMYGVIPGIHYGWPKNVLHFHGIPQTVFDINASLPKTITMVDAIECMEGDGPIMGSAKQMGLLLIGTNPTAVDATACRLMGFDPARVPYLQLAGGQLGPLWDGHIRQRGERWQTLAQAFTILDRPHLREMQAPLAS
ncbi:MAG: iron-sulfur cluster-binding protein [Blastopirellula sp.]|nr:iron-sulfur cluster-binding protein [Blastopirellula sp.]